MGRLLTSGGTDIAAGPGFLGGGGVGGAGCGRLGLGFLVDGGLGDAGGAGPADAGFCLGCSGSGLGAPSWCNCSWSGVSSRSWSSGSSLSSRSWVFPGLRLWLGPGFSSSLLDSYSEESSSWSWSWADDGPGAAGATGGLPSLLERQAWALLRLVALQELW